MLPGCKIINKLYIKQITILLFVETYFQSTKMLAELVVQWLSGAQLFSQVLRCVLIGVAVACFTQYLRRQSRKMPLPPGPYSNHWPLKSSPINGKLHEYYQNIANQYGGLCAIKDNSQLIILLNDYKLIRELFRKEEFTGRVQSEFTDICGGYGVVNIDGKLWKEQRKFIHHHLKFFGMTYIGARKAQMEGRIMREVGSFLTYLDSQEGEPIDLNHLFQVSISNVICDIIMSVRFSHDDARFRRMMDLIEEGFRLFVSLNVDQQQKKHIIHRLHSNREETGQFIQETIDEHKRTFDPTNIRDLLDAYLLEIQKADEAGSGHTLFDGKDHDRQIQQVMGDLFSAGMETIKSTLLFGILFMLHNPHCCTAVQDELDQVVGRKRLPSLEDLPFLPITEATILETLRLSSVVPLGTIHTPTKDVLFKGLLFPKNSHIVPLLGGVHMNPDLWDKPEEFNPMRFINAEGKVTKPEFFMPFGVGRRTCVGEIMARMELFLFFSSLLHTYNIAPEGSEPPLIEGLQGATLKPRSYRIIVEPRPFASGDNTRFAGGH